MKHPVYWPLLTATLAEDLDVCPEVPAAELGLYLSQKKVSPKEYCVEERNAHVQRVHNRIFLQIIQQKWRHVCVSESEKDTAIAYAAYYI